MIKALVQLPTILLLSPGAGYLSIELSKLGNYKITGMDISKDLVEICKRNAIDAGVQIDFRQGNVSDMPFQSNEFNFIICILAFKNFKEILMYRLAVRKPTKLTHRTV